MGQIITLIFFIPKDYKDIIVSFSLRQLGRSRIGRTKRKPGQESHQLLSGQQFCSQRQNLSRIVWRKLQFQSQQWCTHHFAQYSFHKSA